MLEGITVLNTFIISSGVGIGSFILLGMACIIMGFLVGLAVWDGEIIPAIISSVLSTAIVLGIAGYINKDATDTVRYEVTISEEVNLTEFIERYEIIEQRGDIYVIEERAEETE